MRCRVQVGAWYQHSPFNTSNLPSLLTSATVTPSETKALSRCVFFQRSESPGPAAAIMLVTTMHAKQSCAFMDLPSNIRVGKYVTRTEIVALSHFVIVQITWG